MNRGLRSWWLAHIRSARKPVTPTAARTQAPMRFRSAVSIDRAAVLRSVPAPNTNVFAGNATVTTMATMRGISIPDPVLIQSRSSGNAMAENAPARAAVSGVGVMVTLSWRLGVGDRQADLDRTLENWKLRRLTFEPRRHRQRGLLLRGFSPAFIVALQIRTGRESGANDTHTLRTWVEGACDRR